MNLIPEFPHKAPKGYSYQSEPFKRNITAIWIHNHYNFTYKGGNGVRSIWGFYNSKTKQFHSPINSKSVGDRVNPNDTTPYSAMLLKQTPLESAFV
jgi:hypothetical protein